MKSINPKLLFFKNKNNSRSNKKLTLEVTCFKLTKNKNKINEIERIKNQEFSPKKKYEFVKDANNLEVLNTTGDMILNDMDFNSYNFIRNQSNLVCDKSKIISLNQCRSESKKNFNIKLSSYILKNNETMNLAILEKKIIKEKNSPKDFVKNEVLKIKKSDNKNNYLKQKTFSVIKQNSTLENNFSLNKNSEFNLKMLSKSNSSTSKYMMLKNLSNKKIDKNKNSYVVTSQFKIDNLIHVFTPNKKYEKIEEDDVNSNMMRSKTNILNNCIIENSNIYEEEFNLDLKIKNLEKEKKVKFYQDNFKKNKVILSPYKNKDNKKNQKISKNNESLIKLNGKQKISLNGNILTEDSVFSPSQKLNREFYEFSEEKNLFDISIDMINENLPFQSKISYEDIKFINLLNFKKSISEENNIFDFSKNYSSSSAILKFYILIQLNVDVFYKSIYD